MKGLQLLVTTVVYNWSWAACLIKALEVVCRRRNKNKSSVPRLKRPGFWSWCFHRTFAWPWTRGLVSTWLSLGLENPSPGETQVSFWELRHGQSALTCAHLTVPSLKRTESCFHLPKWLVNHFEDFENSNYSSLEPELSQFIIHVVRWWAGFPSRPWILWDASLEHILAHVFVMGILFPKPSKTEHTVSC